MCTFVGAGAAGSSSAYYLRQFLKNSTIFHGDGDNFPVEITVFEERAYVGGRSTTVNAYDDPAEPVELGASIFVSVNHNLVSAAEQLGLVVSSADEVGQRVQDEPSDVLGVYDGEQLLFTVPDGKWWSWAKLIYRYGPTAPWRTQKLAESVVSKFLTMYQAPVFPFASLSRAVQDIGLQTITGVTGLQFLEANGITGRFAQELIQASTRVNYGQNLGLIHGVETMVCMSTDGAMSVQGGNWRIFHGMVNSSKVDLKLQTAVTALSRADDAQEWTVTYNSDGMIRKEIYDAVILAGPLQYAHLAIKPALEKVPDVIPYATVHVTLFASPRRLDPTYFGLKAGQLVPQVVLTTLTEAEQANEKVMRGEGKDAVGSVGFFSVSTLRSVSRPPNDTAEYLYKVFSPEEFGDEKVKQMLGCTGDDGPEQEGKKTITWMHRHVWKAYPYEYPRVTFEDIKLAPGLWYTAGIESFISTMETSSLMGMNVARLVVDEWEAEKKKQKEGSEKVEEKEKEEEEKVGEEGVGAVGDVVMETMGEMLRDRILPEL